MSGAAAAALGWKVVSEGDITGWRLQDRQPRATSIACPLIAQGPYLDDYELVLNACPHEAGVEDEGYGRDLPGPQRGWTGSAPRAAARRRRLDPGVVA